jgi:hypothetical protein
MEDKKLHRGVRVLALVFIALLLATFILPPLPKPKARASRISTVNHLASVSMMIPTTNAQPSAPTNK